MVYIIPTDTCFGIACSIYDISSYHRIYEIKKRDFSKPLAIMVEDFLWLEKYTDLNDLQIDFLKKYPRPWTVLANCQFIKDILNKGQNNIEYKNKDVYSKIAFRVANNDIQKNLIKKIGPIFLTSANFSNEKEIYNVAALKETFNKFENIVFLVDKNLDEKILPSDIFEFIDDSLNIKYIRKN